MAWTYVMATISAQNKVSSTTLSGYPFANLPVGAIIAVQCSTDNPAGPEGETNYHSLSDSKGNTWTKIREQTRSPAGSAADGVTSSLWISQLTTEILTSDTITLTVSTAVTAKTMSAHEFSAGAGNTWSVAGQNAAVGNTATPSVTISGLPSQEYLFLGQIGIEGPEADTFTDDPDYLWKIRTATYGGSPTSNIVANFSHRIATLTGDTYNPTLDPARDWATILGAIKEAPAPGVSETITAKEFPMSYFMGAPVAKELRSHVSGATLVKVAMTFPPQIIKKGKAHELSSKWTS